MRKEATLWVMSGFVNARMGGYYIHNLSNMCKKAKI